MRIYRNRKKYKKRDKKIVSYITRTGGRKEKQKCHVTTVYLPGYLLDKIEEYVMEGRYPSRSEFIREATKIQVLIEERILIPIKEKASVMETEEIFTIDGKEYKKLGEA